MNMPTQAEYKKAGVKIKRPTGLSTEFKFILPPFVEWDVTTLRKGLHFFVSLSDMQQAYPIISLVESLSADDSIFQEKSSSSSSGLSSSDLVTASIESFAELYEIPDHVAKSALPSPFSFYTESNKLPMKSKEKKNLPTQAEYKKAGVKIVRPTGLSTEFKFILPPFVEWDVTTLRKDLHFFVSLSDIQKAYPLLPRVKSLSAGDAIFQVNFDVPSINKRKRVQSEKMKLYNRSKDDLVQSAVADEEKTVTTQLYKRRTRPAFNMDDSPPRSTSTVCSELNSLSINVR
jgi:hypothetical protein